MMDCNNVAEMLINFTSSINNKQNRLFKNLIKLWKLENKLLDTIALKILEFLYEGYNILTIKKFIKSSIFINDLDCKLNENIYEKESIKLLHDFAVKNIIEYYGGETKVNLIKKIIIQDNINILEDAYKELNNLFPYWFYLKPPNSISIEFKIFWRVEFNFTNDYFYRLIYNAITKKWILIKIKTYEDLSNKVITIIETYLLSIIIIILNSL